MKDAFSLQHYWYHSITISIVYLIVSRLLIEFMRNRKPMNLTSTLILWNWLLAACR